MPPLLISATEASRSFSDILNRVYYQGQVFNIKKGKEIIAKIVPATISTIPSLQVKDFNHFLQSLPPLEKEDREDWSATLQKIRQIRPDGNRRGV